MIDYGDTVFAAQRRLKKGVRAIKRKEIVTQMGEPLAQVATKEKELVLVIDDSTAMVEVLSDVLEFLDCEVLAALDGREGLALFETKRKDVALVILDMNMPVMSGEETLQRLRELDPGVQVIISSSISEDEAKARCQAQGQSVPHFLPKPYELDQARQLVNDVLRSA